LNLNNPLELTNVVQSLEFSSMGICQYPLQWMELCR